MIRLIQLAIVVPLLAASAALHAQEPQIVAEKIDDNTYVLFGGRGLGATVGMSVGEDGILLVDTMVAESSEKLLAAIREISDKPIRYVINTHPHADHTGGNRFFAERGAIIIGHQNAQYYSGAAGDILVSDGFSLTFNGQEIRAYHLKAHTDADLNVHFVGSNLLFLGDTFTNTWHLTAIGFGLRSELDATDLALSIGDQSTVVVPGHGVLDDKDGLRRNRDLAQAWFARVAELVRDSADLETIIADPQIDRLRRAFVEKSDRYDTIPENRFRRFVERTLSADFMAPYPMREADLRAFAGVYRTDAGNRLEIGVCGNWLCADDRETILEQLKPLSPTAFHIRFSLSGRYRFTLDDAGKAVRLVREAGDNRLEAERVD